MGGTEAPREDGDWKGIELRHRIESPAELGEVSWVLCAKVTGIFKRLVGEG